MKRYGKIGVFLLLTIFVALVSCNKKFDKLLPATAYSDSTNTYKAPKVLYIIVDGARGWSVRDAVLDGSAPNIKSLTGKSIYSWYSVSDSLGNDGNGWADMLTGVTKAKHNVIDNTFAGNKLAQYPSIFSRIKTISPKSRLAAFSASAVFNANLTAGADTSKTFADDSSVKSAVVTELGNDASTLIVGEFNGVNTAGAANTNGYDNSFPQYKAAIVQFDQYLGQMLTALRARKNYAKENWLVIVTSNHGGPATIPADKNDNTIMSYPQANTFTIIYNDNYTTKLIDKPFAGSLYAGSFLHLYSTANADANSVFAKVTNNNNIYNLADTASMTIEFKIKKTLHGSNYDYQWPIFLCKKDTTIGTGRTGRGWSIGLEFTTWRFLMVNASNIQFGINGGPNILDGNWHSCAVVITNSGSTRIARTYQDGAFAQQATIPAGVGNIDNSAALRLGNIKVDGTTFDGYVSDIRIWKAALSDATIAQFSCQGVITPSHPNYPYLVGYWLGKDGSGKVIHDSSPFGNDFNVSVGSSTTLQWPSSTGLVCPASSAVLSALVPRNVDLPRQILSWLTIAPVDSWGLNGRVWLDN